MCTMTTCFFVLPLNVGVHLCVAFIVISGMFEVITNTILLADNYPLRVTDTLQQAIILFVLFIIYYIMLIADIIMHFIMSYSAHKKNHALMFITLLYAAGKTATEVLRLCITNLFFYVNTLFLFTMTIFRCFFLVVEYSFWKELETEDDDEDSDTE
ncbi:uncharacterized protein LOC106660990 isoform X2 [Cimex lectularius]|uniref:Uncharacterized protein n=1 Tax=Cimex lectularius TaxID=79782 RepID=A0A8I6R939_CIMLE|nr:uncharacterized protein LOC106660990 isoform X2 [Cimex lectularius]